ncbi:hypothetical protein EHS25_009922 [Saitozyma podzolica]|uniref:Wax synthase domain-containing protein n=1 Tax=Saitozyma podzolica TaxID=1890683 RepID=A0A427YI43_9TREE|nr:hypothetical protein EHS25_009922 [Saitozyma podzolica]
MGTADLLLVFLAALPLPPFPPGRAFLPGAFLYPIHLTLLPGAAFSPLPTSIFRTYDVSRSLERLAWAWGVLAGSEALIRTGVRLRRFWASIRSNGDTTDSKSNTKTENQPPPPPPPKGLQSLKIIRVSPVLMSIAIHLLAWRLAVVPPKPVVDPGAWTWPWDVTGLIGIGGGAG